LRLDFKKNNKKAVQSGREFCENVGHQQCGRVIVWYIIIYTYWLPVTGFKKIIGNSSILKGTWVVWKFTEKKTITRFSRSKSIVRNNALYTYITLIMI